HFLNTSATTKNFSAWEDYKSSVDDMQYFLIGLYTLISLAGFVGNLLILTALLKCKQKTVINILIGNLAFSDILVVLFCSPFTLTSCHIMPFLQCASVLVSTLMLISIAAVRYRMIKYPLSSNLTAKQGYFLIVIIWAFGFTICSPLPVFHKTVDLSKTLKLEGLENRLLCIESWPSDSYRIAFTIALLFMQYILPLACLTASHTSVCRSIGEHWHAVSHSIARIKTRSRRVFCRLTVLILVFGFSWMPLHLFHIVTDFNATLISNRHFKLVYCICHLLGMMSCCLNPILYGFLNNKNHFHYPNCWQLVLWNYTEYIMSNKCETDYLDISVLTVIKYNKIRIIY
uniref:Neuropeptide Y receptor type 5 n=1 Tax=Corvus moneduloides TaxID=1196302 RepID=A0A8U7MP65_CORMO